MAMAVALLACARFFMDYPASLYLPAFDPLQD
jgi:hypothetical protein